MNETPRCAHCGKPLPEDAAHCPMCGAGRPGGVTTRPGVASIVLMVLLGIACAIPAWLLLSVAGASILANFGPPSGGPDSEFRVSVGATIFYIVATALSIAGLIVFAQARISALTRAFAVGFLCTALGLFGLCSIFSFSTRG
jgi:hypothetical protein